MRARLFDIYVLASLAGPDGHQRMPVIWCCNRDGVDAFVLEQLANIHVRLRPRQAQILNIFEALVQNPFVDVAQSGNLHSRYLGETADVVSAAAARTANRNAYTVVCPQDL